jgi:hypothetical protein
LPAGGQQRLQAQLDRQDQGTALTPAERQEAEGLINLAELLSLLRLRGQRVAQQNQSDNAIYNEKEKGAKR